MADSDPDGLPKCLVTDEVGMAGHLFRKPVLQHAVVAFSRALTVRAVEARIKLEMGQLKLLPAIPILSMTMVDITDQRRSEDTSTVFCPTFLFRVSTSLSTRSSFVATLFLSYVPRRAMLHYDTRERGRFTTLPSLQRASSLPQQAPHPACQRTGELCSTPVRTTS